jgi:CRP-like cAMP-binding protein
VAEMSIVDGLPRSANVVAVLSSVLSFLRRTAFEDFANKKSRGLSILAHGARRTAPRDRRDSRGRWGCFG